MKVDKGDQFKCDLCGQTFTAEATHEETQAEYEATFPAEHESKQEMDVCCDDCWHQLVLTNVGGLGRVGGL